MGLCKCPRKTITNQFCFEHRVNACEYCMVDIHSKCVVQSYLQWLNDSDYNPVCQLCQEELVSAECIRLVCYDIFHRSCLNDWASKLPANTAPAGYRCPVCSSAIFPAPNLVSPVADALRVVLKSYEWARAGLGMPIVKGAAASSYPVPETKTESSGTKVIGTHQNSLQGDRGKPDGHDTSLTVNSTEQPYQNSSLGGSSQHRSSSSTASAGKPRKPVDSAASSSSLYISEEEDTGENKYKRRPALEWFNRWLRTFQRPSSRHHQGILGGRRRMGFLLAILTICSVLVLLSYLGRNASHDDPMLDPFNNPNIRVEEEKL